jgi:hypothetical protein
LKIQFGAIAEGVPNAMLEKSPDPWSTNELGQVITSVAVDSEVVSNATVPPKSMLPTIG